ncbi:AAEL006331-PA [Aedes aegypti]|uniref:Transcription termination factor 2 n=1 Tax=Aedes aegypti TaxID=7159 RepID=Q176J2_AEDAE|nr:AAEL006331-PA [Aedes aegypti]
MCANNCHNSTFVPRCCRLLCEVCPEDYQEGSQIRMEHTNGRKSAGEDRKSNGNDQVVNISWDDIQKEADKIQPKHTGKQGIATFETQKTITLDSLSSLHKSIEGCPSEDTFADPPKLLRIELMDHQRHALAWMLWRESLKPRGGILADDMGLGKTLSMISLILKKAEIEDPDKENDDSSDDEEEENNGWTAKGRRDYYAGGTLIICPASLMRQWEGEIKNRVARNSLAVNVYHGTNRDMKPRHLAKYDVLITTYNIASRESKTDRSGIFGVNWERIILDEAHMIRNHKSAMSEACCRLKGRFRWVLTGTPIQNKEMDMYALLKFLRCTPFDDLTHWKKWIDNKTAGGMARLQTIMKSLMLRRTKKQLQEKGSLQCLPEKNVELVEVTLEKDEMNVYQKVLLYSRTLFGQFLHQRAEKEHDTYMGANQRNVPTFAQNRLPNMAFDRVHQKLKQMHANEEVKQFQILVLLLRLRQICCHPGLIHQMLEDDDGNFDMSTVEEENAQELDLLAQLNKLKLTDNSADAAVDGPEAQVELDISGNTSQDTAAITKASSKVMLRSNPVFDLTRMSSKIARLLELLDEKILCGDDKAVIVSQWSSVLDIVAHHLSSKRVKYVSLTGKVAVKFRNDIVTEFNKQGSGPKVMLLSLTAGGVGLNLVGANHLLLLDLHWNPQLEAQAQDRVYRVGQKKTVFVWKFMCVETVEQAIRGLQEKKIGIANEVLTGTKQKGSKLSIDDLKQLFGM